MGIITKPRCALAALVIISFTFLIYQRQPIWEAANVIPVRISFPSFSQGKSKTNVYSTTKITDDDTLDNLLRTQSQCLHDYPDLYDSIDASTAHYKDNPIQRANLEEAFKDYGGEYTWVVIRNNHLFVRSRHGGFQSRVQAVLADLNRAITTSPERLPNIEFLFNTADAAPSDLYTPIFGLSRALTSRAFLLADFGYWAWPETLVNGFTSFSARVAALETSLPFSQKTDQLFWRGNVYMHHEREHLVSISDKHNDTWGNVRHLDWGNVGPDDRWDMSEHCRFKYLAHVEGATYSARLKYLQFCNSVIVTHEPAWTTPLSHLWVREGPAQNVVVVGEGFEGLEEVMGELMGDEERARGIAERGRSVFGGLYGGLGAEVCYWRQVIRGYHSVMAAEFQRSVDEGEGGPAKDYESVMLMGTTEWGIV